MVLKRLMKIFKKKSVKKSVKKTASKQKTKIKKVSKKRVLKVSRTSKPVKKIKTSKEELVAEAIHYFSHIKVAILRIKKPLALNDKIHIKGHTTDFTQNIQSMQMNHQPVDLVKKGQEIGILVKGKVRHKDKVYKVS